MFKKTDKPALHRENELRHREQRNVDFLEKFFPDKEYSSFTYVFVVDTTEMTFGIQSQAIGEPTIKASGTGVSISPESIKNLPKGYISAPDWPSYFEIQIEKEHINKYAWHAEDRGEISCPTGHGGVFVSINVRESEWPDFRTIFEVARASGDVIEVQVEVKKQLPHSACEFGEEIVGFSIHL